MEAPGEAFGPKDSPGRPALGSAGAPVTSRSRTSGGAAGGVGEGRAGTGILGGPGSPSWRGAGVSLTGGPRAGGGRGQAARGGGAAGPLTGQPARGVGAAAFPAAPRPVSARGAVSGGPRTCGRRPRADSRAAGRDAAGSSPLRVGRTFLASWPVGRRAPGREDGWPAAGARGRGEGRAPEGSAGVWVGGMEFPFSASLFLG